MIVKLFSRFFGKAAASTIKQSAAKQIADIPRYPPFDKGLPAVTPDEVLESQQELIDRIEKTAGLTPDEFNSKLMPIIRNLARYVHLLPATNTGHHRGAGGLFRMALEMGLYSLQIANSTIYANKGSVSTETRYRLHPKWVFATFIAGLCSEIYRPITNMFVVDDEGEKWPQLLIPLHDWISSRNKERYFIIWNIQDEIDVIGMNQASTAYLLNAVVPMSSLQYLNEDNSEIVGTMTACVTGAIPQGVTNQLRKIVVGVRNKVIERDIKSNSERYGSYTVGSHLEPHLIDAMRRLIRKKSWEVNVKGARIWFSAEGMFIVWQPAAREIISLLTEDNQAGIPQDSDTLADILVTSGIAERNDDDGRYWDICIPGSMQILAAIKVNRVEVLFPDSSDLIPTTECLIPSSAPEDDDEEPPAPIQAAKPVKKAAPTPAPAPAAKTTGQVANIEPVTPQAELALTEPPPASSETAGQIDGKQAQQQDAEPVAPQSASAPAPAPEKTPKADKPARNKSASKADDLGALADKLFASLPRDVSDLLRAIVDDFQDSSSGGPVFSVEGGIAISSEELDSHGQDNPANLIKTLYDKNWLWTDPEKPMRKRYDEQHKGKKYSVIIIRSDIARGMGFDWKKPKKSAEPKI